MEWKKRLYDIAKFSGEKPKDIPSEPQEAEATTPVQSVDAGKQPAKVDPIEEERQEKDADETNPDFRVLVEALGLKRSENKYYRVRDILYEARRRDVTYDVNRWIEFWLNRMSGEQFFKTKGVVDRLLHQGYVSEAYGWWRSAQPEEMQHGTATREKRLEKAEEFARKAGVSLEEIIRNRKGE